jgi:hypothetical protein
MARSKLLDQFSRPLYQGGSRKQLRGSERNGAHRPAEPTDLRGIDEAVNYHDHAQLITASRVLFANHGVLKAAVKDKATWSVGDHWRPIYRGTDTAWGRQATAWLRRWMLAPDVRGASMDWATLLYLNSVALDRDGDILVVFARDMDGKALIQHIPAIKVGQRQPDLYQIQGGKYDGARMVKGVIVDQYGTTKGWNVLGDPGQRIEDVIVDASEGMLLYDPDYHEQLRGLPSVSASLNALRDSLTSHEWEQIALLNLSDLALIEHNEHGGPEAEEVAIVGGATTGGEVTEHKVGGTTRYFRASDGGRIEQIKHERPGDVWDRFQNRIIRSALAEMGWSYNLVWHHEGTSVAEHAEINKAAQSVQDRQSVLRRFALAAVIDAVSTAIDIGELPQADDITAWDFTLPARISLNISKDGNEYRQQMLEGHLNETEWQGWRGRRVEDHYRERALEVAARKRIAAEVSAETGIDITDQDMAARGVNDLADRSEDTNDLPQ